MRAGFDCCAPEPLGRSSVLARVIHKTNSSCSLLTVDQLRATRMRYLRISKTKKGVVVVVYHSHVRQTTRFTQGEHGRAVADAVGRNAVTSHLTQQPLRLFVAPGPSAGRHSVVVTNRLFFLQGGGEIQGLTVRCNYWL